MRYLLIFVALLSSINLMAQKQLQIVYENEPFRKLSNIKSSKIKLFCTKDACFSTIEDLWVGISLTFGASSRDITQEEDTKVILNHVYKDYTKNMLYCYDSELIKCYIKETQTQFSWKISSEKKQILGYDCTKATTHYRGRNYTAWFTTQLPFKAAPWKFHGLPGVVLEVKSKDLFVSMEAIKLKVTEGEMLENPFKTKKFIYWEEFTQLYKKELVKNQKQLIANHARFGLSTDFKISRPRVEVIVDANR